MNQTVFDYCGAQHLEQTRSRAYKKNDQAWVEQKNGSIVRRLVGYGRLSGLPATQALADLYAVSRLYINFFQPSFKLKSKRRDGAHVSKTYYTPKTPCERLLAIEEVDEEVKAALRMQFVRLDPVALLQAIRAAQRALADITAHGVVDACPPEASIATFLESLTRAWQNGEVRPTHRQQAGAHHWWRTRTDPFEQAWPLIEYWLGCEPTATAKGLMERLASTMPDVYVGTTQLRTLQRRIKDWRAMRANALVLGHLQRTSNLEEAAMAASSRLTEQQTTANRG
jgi:hypothetical protein